MLKNVKKSRHSKICSGAELNNVSIDIFSYVGHFTKINNAEIGKYCSIAGNCIIGGGSHPVEWVSTSPRFHTRKSILGKGITDLEYSTHSKTIIENDVWIGTNVLIKSGVKIGNGAVIGMGSVVTHDIPPYEIWAGNPAKLIRKRFDDDTIEKINSIRWWALPEHDIKLLANQFNNPQLFIKSYKEMIKNEK